MGPKCEEISNKSSKIFTHTSAKQRNETATALGWPEFGGNGRDFGRDEVTLAVVQQP